MPKLPVDSYVSIYPRQSTTKQVGNIATEMQTDDLIAFAQKYGWKQEMIILYYEDLGVSGQLRMDEREGFTKMLRDITSGKVKAVIAFQVDRLFRDEWGVEYGKFMEICYTYGVIVITPEFIYDFSVDWHVDRFRRKCEEAYSFLRNQVKGRLIAARDRLARQGVYVVGSLPTGYIVDRRPTLDGAPNPQFRKFMIYEPHAQIVRYLFRRYRALGGKLSQLYRELHAQTIVFPPFDKSIDPRTLSKVALKQVSGGYHLSFQGLTTLLTNPAYIGWGMFKNEIISKTNHEPIIDEETFWYAFNRLSKYTVDGKRNEQAAGKRHATYVQKDKPESEVLLKDVIKPSSSQTKITVNYAKSTREERGTPFYSFRHRTSPIGGEQNAFAVREVDRLFADSLLSHLRTTEDFAHYRTYLERQRQEFQAQQAGIDVQIVAVTSQMATIKQNLKALTNPRLFAELDETYTKLEEELTRLNGNRQTPSQQQSQITQLLTYYELMSKLDWEKDVTLEEKKTLITFLVASCILDVLSPRFYRLAVHWRVPAWGIDEAIVYRRGQPASHWTKEEDDLLCTRYESTDKGRLLHLFPSHSWTGISTRASRLGLRKDPGREREVCEIPDKFCVQDWQFMQTSGITQADLASHNAGVQFVRWSEWRSAEPPPVEAEPVR